MKERVGPMPKRVERSSNKKASIGLGLGLTLGLGVSSSSMKPPLQEGHTRSEDGDGVTLTVRLHWWQKYICGCCCGGAAAAAPPKFPPEKDM